MEPVFSPPLACGADLAGFPHKFFETIYLSYTFVMYKN